MIIERNLMKQCKVCLKELEDAKFGNTYHTLSTGIRKAYKDSTCMVCRRNKHLENPEKRKIHREGTKNWCNKYPDKLKNQRLRKYGITLEDYNILREQQNFCCAICKRHEEEVEQSRSSRTAYALHVDHCHTTHKIRGLLCSNCNTMLGKVRDSVDVLRSAIEYLGNK